MTVSRKTALAAHLLVLGFFLPGAALAGALLEPIPAPDWKVSEWINGDPGRLSENKGKVVIIDFFQLWCPGCNNFSIPLMEQWQQKWSDRDELLFVSIHTVFEGHEVQTTGRLREFLQQKGIDHPVGVDHYSKPGDEIPFSMRAFKTEGTPHLVIVDRQGMIRFSHFGFFDRGPVEHFIERVLAEKTDQEVAATKSGSSKTTPSSRYKAKTGSRSPDRSRSSRTRVARPDARSPDGDDSQDEEENVPDEISGKYKLTVVQTSKSCGDLLPQQTILADVSLSGGKIEARFTRPFLGIRSLQADYDPDRQEFDADLSQRTEERNIGVEVELELRGRFEMQAGVQTLEYEFMLEKQGDEEGLECTIEGNGQGTRTGR